MNHPINIIPKKSNILPRKPFVLLEVTAPCLFVTPETVEDSNSSSLCLLLAFSLLFSKKLLSLPIRVLLNLLFSFVFLTISVAVSLELTNPLVKFTTVLLIELILSEDFNSEFLLALISDIIPSHYT